MSPAAPNARSPVPFAAVLCGLVCTFAILLVARPTAAQELDTALPDIETGVLGEPQLLEADVGADVRLARIRLLYRFDGGESYAPVPMRPTTRPGVYAATVPTSGLDAERLEFYIVAEREDGGTLSRGSASTPLVRELVPSSSTAPIVSSDDGAAARNPQAPPPAEPGAATGKVKYLYLALGVLAVGALAAASSDGGGGGDGGGAGCGDDGCDVTLAVPPLP